MCIREKSWNKHFPFISKKKYIFVLSISAARYTSSTLLLTHYKSSIIWSKLFMSFTTAIDFFVLVAILFLNRKSQNWNVFQQGIWNFRTWFLYTIHNCFWHCEVVVTVQTDHVNKKEDGTATNKEWILYADYIFLIWIIHCLHSDVYKVALC